LFIDVLVEQRTFNAASYSKLLKDEVKPYFRSKRRGQSVKSVCLLHDNKNIRGNALGGTATPPHPACSPGLTAGGFHLFGPVKEALGGKRFRDKLFESGIRKVPE
jgi:hypothetical protein